MPDLPPSARDGGDKSRFDQLHEGVPVWLFDSLAEWLRRYFGSGRYQDSVVRELEVGLRVSVPAFDRDAYVMDESYRFDDVVEWSRADPARLLDVVDWALRWSHRFFFEDFDDPTTLDQHVSNLVWLLRQGGSTWTVRQRPDGRYELQRWVEPHAVAAADAAVASSDDPDDHLAHAWSAAFGFAANPRDAYREAVNAVEHVACPLVLPNKADATLGDVIGTMRSAQHKWAVRFRSNPNRAPQSTPVEVVVSACELLWNSDPRHGNDPRGAADLPESRSAVHLAVLLVTWFTDGTIARVGA